MEPRARPDASQRSRRRLSHWLGKLLLLVAVAIALVVVGPSVAQAQSTIEVETLYDNLHRAGMEVPIRIEIAAERLIDGTVVVEHSTRNSNQTFVFSSPIEIAAGTTKELLVVVPPIGSFGATVAVRLVENNRTTAETELRAEDSESDFVGVLPGLAGDIPDRVDLVAEVGEALIFEIEPAWIERLPGSITGLQTIVATEPALADLEPSALRTLLTWVFDGGTLLVDSSTNDEFEVLPLAMRPGTKGLADYGRGRVIATDGAAGRGDWKDLLAPGSVHIGRGDDSVAQLTGDLTFFGPPLAFTTADDAGAEVFELRWIAIVLIAYALLAVPMGWLFVRRYGHPAALWLALPILAAATTGIVWMIGSSTTTGSDDAHATTIEISSHSATATSALLVTSRNGETRTVRLPSGWHVINEGRSPVGGGNGFVPMNPMGQIGTSLETSSNLTNSWVATELEPGGFALLNGTGEVSQYANAIELVARSADSGQVSGAVTNNLSIDVHEVGLFADLAGTNLGTIPAGETVEFTFDGPPRDPFRGNGAETTVWPAVFDNSGGPFAVPHNEPSVVNSALWANFLSAHAGAARPPGQVVIAAWTAELPSPATALIESGRTLFIARANTEPVGRVTDMTMIREVVRSGRETPREFQAGNVAADSGATWRFRAPAAITVADRMMVIDVPRHTALAIWVGGEWVEIGLDGNSATMHLPAQAFVGPGRSEVYVRLFVSQQNGPGLSPRQLSVTQAEADDEPRPFITYREFAVEQARLEAEKAAEEAKEAAEEAAQEEDNPIATDSSDDVDE